MLSDVSVGGSVYNVSKFLSKFQSRLTTEKIDMNLHEPQDSAEVLSNLLLVLEKSNKQFLNNFRANTLYQFDCACSQTSFSRDQLPVLPLPFSQSIEESI